MTRSASGLEINLNEGNQLDSKDIPSPYMRGLVWHSVYSYVMNYLCLYIYVPIQTHLQTFHIL